nr:hypothetical protein [Candidatus Nitrosopumilus sediminis]
MIGLEIHCQLTNLNSKLFCPCKANYRGFKINENICPICMGLPGSLPRLNQEAVKKSNNNCNGTKLFNSGKNCVL